MAIRTLCARRSIFLILLMVIVQSKCHTASQEVYQGLEDALFSNSSLLYKMQEVFVSSKILPRDLVFSSCVCDGRQCAAWKLWQHFLSWWSA